jgi:predicted  nucleic acid-binding Zn-ribbon protein
VDQQRIEDLGLKQQVITRLESQLREEQRRRSEEMEGKQKKIEELERDIEQFLQDYVLENESLKREITKHSTKGSNIQSKST